MNFEREELQRISARADADASIPYINPHWKRALEALATAADHLDAMIARSSVGVPDIPVATETPNIPEGDNHP